MVREMKDSGVEWIGEIPTKWPLTRMKSCISGRDSGAWGDEPSGEVGDCICLRVADFDYAKFSFRDTPIDELTVRHYKAETIKKLTLNRGDILIEKSGGGEKTPVGRTVIFDKTYKAIFANFMDRLICAKNVFPKWMQYVFATFYKNNFVWNYIKQTTGIQNLDLTAMLREEIVPCPNINEQQCISDFLDARCAEIDAVIEKTEASIKEYKKLKQAIITQAVTKGIRGDRPTKDSGIEWIGKVPKSWKICRIKDVCRTQTGTTPSTTNPDWFDGEIRWYTPVDFNEKYILKESSRTLNQQAKNDNVVTMIPPHSVMLVGIGGTVGKVGYVSQECSCNQQITALHSSTVFPMFLMYWLIANSTFLKETALYTTLPIINNQTLGNYPMLAPFDDIEEREIADFLDERCTKIDICIEKKKKLVAELESYKRSLIYEYVTGKKEA